MSHKTKAAEFIGEEYSLTITGRNNFEVTDPMRQYVLEKTTKLEKFGLRIVSILVIMEIQKLVQGIDIVLKVDHIVVKSHGSSTDMYASIDMAIDKLQTQLRRYHRRIREHHARRTSSVDMAVNVIQSPQEQELLDVNMDIEDETHRHEVNNLRPHDIVKTETHSLKVLTQGEAIMKMELSGDIFLIYRSEEDKKLKVIYRRKDGNYGIIAPES